MQALPLFSSKQLLQTSQVWINPKSIRTCTQQAQESTSNHWLNVWIVLQQLQIENLRFLLCGSSDKFIEIWQHFWTMLRVGFCKQKQRCKKKKSLIVLLWFSLLFSYLNVYLFLWHLSALNSVSLCPTVYKGDGQWEEDEAAAVCRRHLSSACRRLCWPHG